MRTSPFAWAILFACPSVLSCSPSQPPIDDRALCLAEDGTPPILVGDTFTIAIGPVDDSDWDSCLHPSPAPRVWSSSDPAVLAVDSDGFVQALSEGTASISLDHQQQQADVLLKVGPKVSWLGIVPDSATLDPGDSLHLGLLAHDAAGRPIRGVRAMWFAAGLRRADGSRLIHGPVEFYRPGARGPYFSAVIRDTVTLWAHDTGATYVKVYTRQWRDSLLVRVTTR